MNSKTVDAGTRSPAMILTYTDIRSYIFTSVFVALSVLVPWVFHQFHLAGPTFLPMHIFVLMAGLLFGWRAGVTVGGLTVLISYGVSGMPALTVLPQIVVELSAYGFAAGLLREKLNLPVIWALLGAMLAGRLALLVAVSVMYLGANNIYSPLGPATNPLTAVWTTMAQGWPGIVLHLALIPLSLWLLGEARTKLAGSHGR